MNKKLDVIILDDKEPDFNVIKDAVLLETFIESEKIESQIVYDYNSCDILIRTYTNFKKAGIKSRIKYENSMKSLVSKISSDNSNSRICIIDVNWGYTANDHFGIDFYKEFLYEKVQIENIIFISILDRSELKEEFSGAKFMHKKYRDDKGDIQTLGELFKEALRDNVNALPAIINFSAKEGNEPIEKAIV